MNPPEDPAPTPSDGELHDRLMQAALDRGDESVSDVMLAAQGRGSTVRQILEGPVRGVAAELGRLWSEDELSFLDVTISSGKLHRAIHELRSYARRPRRSELGRILVTTVPGEQHALGAAVAEQLLWLEGCETSLDVRGSRDIDDQAATGFDAVAIAVPCERSVPRLAEMIDRLRRGLHGPGPRDFLLGGAFASPALAEEVGADATVGGVEELLERLGRNRPPTVP